MGVRAGDQRENSFVLNKTSVPNRTPEFGLSEKNQMVNVSLKMISHNSNSTHHTSDQYLLKRLIFDFPSILA